jgi:hypothetical protein
MISSPSVLERQIRMGTALGSAIVTDLASATSRPDGEMVADPILRGTSIERSASKVVLSNADLMTFDFLASSIIVTGQLQHDLLEREKEKVEWKRRLVAGG